MEARTLNGAAPRMAEASAGPPREVVAAVVHWRGRLALFKRSRTVGHEQGLWHCVTGYLERGASPEQQVLTELQEEAGLARADLASVRRGERLLIPDAEGNPWLIHTFAVTSTKRRLVLNDEHDDYRWTLPAKISRFSNRVPWLDAVLQAAGP